MSKRGLDRAAHALLEPRITFVNPNHLAGFLELGAVVNPLEDDLKFYKELSEKYKEFLKAAKLDAKRLDPAPDKDGSLELYAYYHLGLPSFAMDFWTLPEVKDEKPADEMTPEKLEKMTNDEFIALGEEKIDAFLKASGAPDQFKAKQVIEALKGGMLDTKKMAEMMKQMPKKPSGEGADPKEKALLAWSDKELGGKGFVAWKPFKHPTLGDVEIVEFKANRAADGRSVHEVEAESGCRVVAISRRNSTLIPDGETALQAGDIIVAGVKEAAFTKLERYMEE